MRALLLDNGCVLQALRATMPTARCAACCWLAEQRSAAITSMRVAACANRHSLQVPLCAQVRRELQEDDGHAGQI
jgi:hypothetical protein